MCRIVIAMMLAVFLSASVAIAEFYKYVDENGVTRYTDNLADVPKDQREKVPKYKEAKTVEPVEQKTDAETDEAVPTVETLKKMKEELNQEYADMMEERKVLFGDNQALKTPEETDAYNRKIEAHNQRAEAYREKQAEYRRMLDAFNAKVRELDQ